MSRPRLRVTYLPGGRVARVPGGTTLFEAAHWIGIPIDSTCGGRGTCGKCAVRLLGVAPEPTPADRRHLDPERLALGWRLACRTEVRADLACEVPRLPRVPRAATADVGRRVRLEPDVRKVLLRLPAPSIEDPRSHLRRIRDALSAQGWEAAPTATALAHLARTMRAAPAEITATLIGDRLADVEPGDATPRALGLALDVGTTTVAGALLDLRTGAVAADGSVPNGQARFGADVIARAGRAMEDEGSLVELRDAVRSSVRALVERLLISARAPREAVYEAVVVGNATMLHLLLGVDPTSIALAPFAPTFLEPLELRAADVGIGLHPEARAVILPSLGAYVGADIVAGILATGLAADDRLRLLVDVGTNGEIVLGSSDRVVATAAPAGPAFEGGQVLHGMLATEGAIERVALDGDVRLEVIGGGDPLGICGTGLIDAVAQLRRAGLLREDGRLLAPGEARGHVLADRLVERGGVPGFALAPDVILTQLDVRALQAAKGAIATGIEVAMETLGIGPAEIDEVLLAGSFGTSIDPASARVVGLVPALPLERIRAVGNVALAGAEVALLSFRERGVALRLPSFVDYVELSLADFDRRFLRNLAFPPLEEVLAG